MLANILVVEDDEAIRCIVKKYLQVNGFKVLEASDGLQAMVIIKTQNIDLVILDILIPHLDGFTVCKYIRESNTVPIIMVTAKSTDHDKLKGYDLGADDYVVKPFNPQVLVAKVKAMITRANRGSNIDFINLGGVCLNSSAQTVIADNQEITLTYKEYQLLKILMKNAGRVFTREQLLNKVWGYDYQGSLRTVDTHIKRLRNKLGTQSKHIVTLIKSGYKFEAKDDKFK
ncbi:response regulator transcription factor [Clostridium sp. 'deep sea']|uniref:response regulator transcription factor n=1 Tax=Clostridium sp. 'deep sea' TaxID=2779445 RepID=UPI0018965E67|nr:response regulator transcription factor [Clostridium sp. 'deep sea']QOR34713.1 response regulator transcription factor [Clostridium sp. 'deep sea']